MFIAKSLSIKEVKDDLTSVVSQHKKDCKARVIDNVCLRNCNQCLSDYILEFLSENYILIKIEK